MELALESLFAIALLSPFASAWNVDPRCPPPPPERRLVPDKFLEEDGLSPDENMVPLNYESDGNHRNGLRGPDTTHRKLEDVTFFRVKMYWQEGYCWQEEWEEREWCLECQGASECRDGDYLWIKECDDDPQQKFIYESVSGTGGGRLKPHERQDLCWERTRDNARQLKPCSSDANQIIKGIKYDGPFEMVPYGAARENDCLTQSHHPKNEEIVRGELCEIARNDKTSEWIMIDKGTGRSEGGGGGGDVGGGDGGGGSSGSDTVNNKGQEYCDTNECGLCEGDCDNDSQCRGDLKCFKRNGYQKIPGCKDSEDKHGKCLQGGSELPTIYKRRPCAHTSYVFPPQVESTSVTTRMPTTEAATAALMTAAQVVPTPSTTKARSIVTLMSAVYVRVTAMTIHSAKETSSASNEMGTKRSPDARVAKISMVSVFKADQDRHKPRPCAHTFFVLFC